MVESWTGGNVKGRVVGGSVVDCVGWIGGDGCLNCDSFGWNVVKKCKLVEVGVLTLYM